MRDFRAVALGLLAILTAPSVATSATNEAECGVPSSQGDRASPLKAELAVENAANDFRFELLQRDVKKSEAIKTAEKPRTGTQGAPVAFAAVLDSQLPFVEARNFDCEKYPVYCDPRLNCSAVTADDRFKWNVQFATDDGHVNLQTWCQAYPKYPESLPACVFKQDLPTYSKYMYAEQAPKGIDKTDGLYCFASGHCTNDKITVNTTMAEAEEICTEIYGDEWKAVGVDSFGAALTRLRKVDHKADINGKQSRKEIVEMTRRDTDVFAMAACAMGNFHCDNIYCKENYCNNPAYKEAYGWAAQFW